MIRIAAILTLPLIASCSSSLTPITDCEVRGDIRPVCDMQTPEDIAALPDGRHLLLAHFGRMGDGTGSISLFDTETETLTPLYPPTEPAADTDGTAWGDASCTQPPGAQIGPHGTHLHQDIATAHAIGNPAHEGRGHGPAQEQCGGNARGFHLGIAMNR